MQAEEPLNLWSGLRTGQVLLAMRQAFKPHQAWGAPAESLIRPAPVEAA